MKTKLHCLIALCLMFCANILFAQKSNKESHKATLIVKAEYVKIIPSIASMGNLIPEEPRTGEINPRRSDGNKVVPGKGFPIGADPLVQKQKLHAATRQGRAPIITFEANSSAISPTDPTGAIGPNHYVSAKNSAFAIHDRSGNVLAASSSLANLFPGETLGDPIVFYDSFADRFVITEFSDTPDGFLVAICQGSDPVNDGWYTYRFNTSSFPDYTKFSVWSDGYYVTANKDQNAPTTNEVVFALERDRMLEGDAGAQMVGFALPGAVTSGFYSPGAFFATGKEMPPPGDATIIYLQDDAWAGVAEDMLKIWTIDVDWDIPANSAIAESQELTVSGGDITSFDSVFDGGGFVNLPQPPPGGDIDAIQATMMYATNYRRFCDYNSVVMNFTVDIDNVNDNVAGVRWYELRQAGDGQPWTVYQEGTYTSPDGKSAWCASMAMDVYGNIGMGYTTVGTTADGASANSFPSLRYTGRLADDALGTMTVTEQTIAVGTGADDSTRYGDYAQMSLDPADDQTFWYIGEYFQNIGSNARNVVAAFLIADGHANDAGVSSLDAPVSSTLTAAEQVTITITNYGNNTLTSIPVSYSVNGGPDVNETWNGSLAAGASTQYNFTQTADLSSGTEFTIDAKTSLVSDDTPPNDCISVAISFIAANDVGVTSIDTPDSGLLGATELITVTIRNFGTLSQSNIPVSYNVDGGSAVNEVYPGPLGSGATDTYVFTATADLSSIDVSYDIAATTNLGGDADNTNDSDMITVINGPVYCEPTSNCTTFDDGVTVLQIGTINHTSICSGTGYADNTGIATDLDRSSGNNVHNGNLQVGFGSDWAAIWIDFNDDGDFDDTGERVVEPVEVAVADTDEAFVITIPTDANLGTHRMRVRGWDDCCTGDGILENPCDNLTWGRTEDFTVNIIDTVLSLGDFTMEGSDFTILSLPNKQFEIILKTPFNDTLTFNLYNMLGQQLVFNYIKKRSGVYTYQLDMSYAASGVYLVKVGTGTAFKTGRIIVK